MRSACDIFKFAQPPAMWHNLQLGENGYARYPLLALFGPEQLIDTQVVVLLPQHPLATLLSTCETSQMSEFSEHSH